MSKRQARRGGARGGGAHLNGADLVKFRGLIEATRASARELVSQGMEVCDIAQTYHLSERAVRDLISDAPAVSLATVQELARRATGHA